jgi:predicted NBD/HSP70 family sugar kinase
MSNFAIGHTPEQIRRHNLGLVLRGIRVHRKISRQKLSEKTHLTKTSVTAIVNELLGLGLIAETGEDVASKRGGRKPIILSTLMDSCIAIGMVIRRNLITAVFLNLAGDIVARKTMILKSGLTEKNILRTSGRCISEILKRTIGDSQLIGIGVAAAGSVDAARGIILDLPDVKIPQTVNIKEALAQQFGMPVFVESAPRAGAVGEYCHRLYSGNPVRDLIFIEIDEGIGCGIISDGNLIQGKNYADDLGHMIVEVGGTLCSCGRRGCLRQYASGTAVLKRLNLIEMDGKGTIPESTDYSKLLSHFIEECEAGKRIYLSAIDKAAAYLGIGVVNISTLLSPDLLVLSSSIPGFAELYLKSLLAHISEDKILNRNTGRLVLSSYGPEAVAAGAAYMVLRAFYDDPKQLLRMSAVFYK